MADIEDQLAELKQQLAEEKESRAAAESAAADRAEEQRRQHEQTMQLLNQLMGKQGGGGAEEQKNQGGEAQAAPVTGGEVENPAPSTPQEDSAANSVVPVEDGPHVDQSGESGQDGDYGLQGETANAHGSRRSLRAPMKMAPPILKESGFRLSKRKSPHTRNIKISIVCCIPKHISM